MSDPQKRLVEVRQLIREKTAERKHHLASFRTLRTECEELNRKRRELLDEDPKQRRATLRRKHKQLLKRLERVRPYDTKYAEQVQSEIDKILVQLADLDMTIDFDQILSEPKVAE